MLPLLGVLAWAIVAGGCSTARALLDGQDLPTARLTDARLTGLHADGVLLDFEIEVRNPYSVPLPVGAVDVALSSRGTPFLTAAGVPGESIPARRTGRVRVPADVGFSEMLALLENVRPGAMVPYRADLGLNLNIPGGSLVTIPLAHEGAIPIPAPPTVSIRSLRWDELTLQRAAGVLEVGLSNPNAFEAVVRTMDYALVLAGTPVAEARLVRPVALAADGGSGTLEIPISFSTTSLGVTVFQALARGEIAYALTGQADVETPFGSVRLPFSGVGRTSAAR